MEGGYLNMAFQTFSLFNKVSTLVAHLFSYCMFYDPPGDVDKLAS